MAVKLLAFDLDETTIIGNKYLPDENREALFNAKEKGVILVPATGRVIRFIPKEILELNYLDYAITSNGGDVYNLKNLDVVYSSLLPRETALKIEELLLNYPVYLDYYIGQYPVTKERDRELAKKKYNIPQRKYVFLDKEYKYVNSLEEGIDSMNCLPSKIFMPYLPDNLREEILFQLSKFDDISVTYSFKDNLEINHKYATKGYALEYLCKSLNINKSEVMAIGDNGNDISMLKYAGVSVAMGNAEKATKAASKHVTDTCENFGFAKAVNDFILK